MTVPSINPEEFLSEESKGRNPSPLSALTWKYNTATCPGLISLAGGFPNAEFFPIENLTFATDRATFSIDKHSDNSAKKVPNVPTVSPIELAGFLQYSPPKGHPKMLAECRKFAEALHRPKYPGWDILVNSGGGDAIEKAFNLLCNPGDKVLVENYSYPATLELMRSKGYIAVPVEMDAEGLSPTHMESILQNEQIKVLYTIPSGQNPMGCTQSTQRRKEIYALAQKYNLVICEDDPYAMLTMPKYVPGELPSRSRQEYIDSLPVSYLSLDTDARVVHLNSFSKLFSPGMRIGYTVACERFIERMQQHVSVTTRHANGMAQAMLTAVLAAWGTEGWLDWCFDIAERYVVRRSIMLDALQPLIEKGWVEVTAPSCGMFLVVKINLKAGHDLKTSLERLFHESIHQGVLIVPGQLFASAGNASTSIASFVRLTYASPTKADLSEGIRRFGRALELVCS